MAWYPTLVAIRQVIREAETFYTSEQAGMTSEIAAVGVGQ
jgi:hypothetical protein